MKRAVVTGGTRGIGLAACRLLFQKGYCVTALYSSDEAAAGHAEQELAGVEFVKADVSNEAAVKAVFEKFSAIDLLVNNAGVCLYKQVQDTSWADWSRIMEVNAGGAFLCTKYAVKKMLDGGGAIVNVASVWGETGGSCESAYSASKGAVIAFTKAAAKELAPSHVTVNCVSPGVVDTQMMQKFSEEEKRELREEIPLGRFASCEEIAQAIVFLAEHKYITGQVLSVNGGFYI